MFDLNPLWHLIVRAEVGVSAIADFSDLPGSRRFFAGGDRSVRGFGLNELSPLDADGNRTGGRHLLVGSIEIERDLPRRFGVAVFFDAGNAMNKLGDPVEYSVGVGFRWRIPVVTARHRCRPGAVSKRRGPAPAPQYPAAPMIKRRTLVIIALSLLVAIGIPVIAVSWLCYTESGLQWLAARVSHVGKVSIRFEGLQGRLTGPLSATVLEIDTQGAHIEVRDLRADTKLRSLLLQTIHADYVEVGRLEILLKPRSKPPEKRPLRLLPRWLRLQADSVAVSSFHAHSQERARPRGRAHQARLQHDQ